MLDDTVMGDTTRSNIAGLLNWSIDVEFLQDFASAKVDATLFALVGSASFTDYSETYQWISQRNKSVI